MCCKSVRIRWYLTIWTCKIRPTDAVTFDTVAKSTGTTTKIPSLIVASLALTLWSALGSSSRYRLQWGLVCLALVGTGVGLDVLGRGIPWRRAAYRLGLFGTIRDLGALIDAYIVHQEMRGEIVDHIIRQCTVTVVVCRVNATTVASIWTRSRETPCGTVYTPSKDSHTTSQGFVYYLTAVLNMRYIGSVGMMDPVLDNAFALILYKYSPSRNLHPTSNIISATTTSEHQNLQDSYHFKYPFGPGSHSSL
jgi:hypothetical protein